MATRASRSRGLLDTANLADMLGVHMSALELDTMIVLHGNSGEFRRCMICPCVRRDIPNGDVGCPDCHGLGRQYPIHLREPLYVLDVQRSATAKLMAAGKLAQGTIQITFPSGVIPAFGDMWLPDQEEHVVTEVLFLDGSRRTVDADLRPFRVSSDSIKQADVGRKERLLYPNPCCIEDVAYKADDGTTLHATPMQYHVDGDGRWTWRIGGPAPGEAWVVRYRAPATYVIGTADPMYRSEADQRMPHRVTAQRLDVASHEDLRS